VTHTLFEAFELAGNVTCMGEDVVPLAVRPTKGEGGRKGKKIDTQASPTARNGLTRETGTPKRLPNRKGKGKSPLDATSPVYLPAHDGAGKTKGCKKGKGFTSPAGNSPIGGYFPLAEKKKPFVPRRMSTRSVTSNGTASTATTAGTGPRRKTPGKNKAVCTRGVAMKRVPPPPRPSPPNTAAQKPPPPLVPRVNAIQPKQYPEKAARAPKCVAAVAPKMGQNQAEVAAPKTVAATAQAMIPGVKTAQPVMDKADLGAIPPHWTGDTTTTTRQPVSDEVMASIQEMMDGTWKDVVTVDRAMRTEGNNEVDQFEIVSVLRNQNPTLWWYYSRKREGIRNFVQRFSQKYPIPQYEAKTAPFLEKLHSSTGMDPLCTDENEMILFHGTTPVTAEAICDSRFKVNLGGNGLFGQGAYFAESSSKSDEYVSTDDDNIFQGLYATLLCRVMMGRVKYTDAEKPKQDKDLLKAVIGDGSTFYPRYNSTLGDREKVRGTYREFVVYDDNQAYPEYIVLYRRVAAKDESKAPSAGAHRIVGKANNTAEVGGVSDDIDDGAYYLFE